MHKIVRSAIMRYRRFKDCSFMIPINSNINESFIYSVNYDYTNTLPILEINVQEEKDLFSFILIVPPCITFEEAKQKVDLLFQEIDLEKENIPANVIQFAVEKPNLIPYSGILSPLPEWVINHHDVNCFFGKIEIYVEMNIYSMAMVKKTTTVKNNFYIHTKNSVEDLLLLIKQSSDIFEGYEVSRLYNTFRDFQRDEKIYEIAIQDLQIYCDIYII
jgi:hypothetical protein